LSARTANLSLDQAPPILVPLRFFLTAPMMGLAAAVLGLLAGPELYSSRWNPYTLAVTHLLTLGFMAQIMCGAILQMLPVVVGAPVPRVAAIAGISHPLLTTGTLLLAASLLFPAPVWSYTAVVCLVAGFTIYLVATGLALWRNRNRGPVFLGLALALVSLLLTLVLGLALLAAYLGWWSLNGINILADVHLSWGLFGWIGLLLIGIAYQVVPMFQVTPEYPIWMKKHLAIWLFVSLFVWSGLQLAQLNAWYIDTIFLRLVRVTMLGGFVLFCVLTLRLQYLRKRRITDVTLLFWRLAMYSGILAFCLWLLAQLFPGRTESTHYPLLLGILLLCGFGCSVMNGMLYKIVPFLSWFHLQNRQLALQRTDVRLPNMKQFIDDRTAKRQLYTFAASMLAALLAAFWPQWLSYVAASLFGLSCLLLGTNLITAFNRYRICYLKLQSPH